MKFSPTQQMHFNDPLIKRAYEIINDLILEYGVYIWVDLEQSTCQISPSLFDDQPDIVHYITAIRYCVGEHKFETISELRKSLINKAFL